MPTPRERIDQIHGDLELDENVSFTYSWNHGYEKLEIHYEETNSGFSFAGSFHPHVVCEGNPCNYCGKAWIEWDDDGRV